MSPSDFREELQYYKEHIDIRDYLEASGYEIDKSRDTARYRAYTHPDTRDKVYIPKNSQYKVPNYYVNQLDNDDKGTLLDFIMSREQKSLDEARLSLRAFHQGYVPSPPPPVEKVNDQKKEKQKYVIQKIVDEHPSGLESPYLKERWLSDETLRHPAFRDKVKLNSYAAEQYLAFPLADHEGRVSGVALKSVNKERILGEKAGVWSSHPSNGKLTIDRMVITEHPIDAMSYHQLFDDMQRNTVYLSTAGNPSNKQIEVIQNYIHLHKPKEIILANDLDKAGQLFNQKYLEKLKPDEAVIHEEKPQFKDWNADLSAWSLYNESLGKNSDWEQVHNNSMVPAPKEIEEALISKNYSELLPKTIENLAVYYIEREFYGSKIKYTLEEVATINKDEKLSRLLEEHIQLSPSSSPTHSFTNNNKSTHAFHKKSHEFEEQAQANLSIGASPVMNQVQANDNDHEYRLIEQRYHKDIDELSSLIEGKASYRELSRKLYYYKHFPHLSDQEIESYMSVEDKHQSQASQGKGFSHQNEQQIEE